MAPGVRKISKEKFFEAYEKWSQEGLSLGKCAKIAGVSVPTLKKYFAVLIAGEEFPDNLF